METILLTGAGAPGMPGILKCLASQRGSIRLIGVDADSNAPSRKAFDCFYSVPMAKDKSFIPSLLEICSRESVDLLVPVVTRELSVLSENRIIFEESGTCVAVMDTDRIKVSNNKGLLFDTLKNRGIRTAPYRVVETAEDISKAIDELGYPGTGVVVKPVIGNGSRGVRLINPDRSAFDAFFDEKPDGMHISRDELMRILHERDELPLAMVVMKLLIGKEYSVDVVARNGQLQAAVCRVGLNVVSSNQTSSMVIDAPEIIDLCESVVSTMGLSGNIGFDLKEDEDGKAFIIEINPRLTGGIVTCLAAGANLPWLGIRSWMGDEVTQPDLRYGVRMQRYWNERFYDENDIEIQV